MSNSFHDLVTDAVVLTHIFLRLKNTQFHTNIRVMWLRNENTQFHDVMWLRTSTNKYGMINDVISDNNGASFTLCKDINHLVI